MFNAIGYGLVGYAVCVLFPMPWLSGFIYNSWAKIMPFGKAVVATVEADATKSTTTTGTTPSA